MKDKLTKRQEEIKKEFDVLEQERVAINLRLQKIEPRLIQLQAIYQELGKIIKETK